MICCICEEHQRETVSWGGETVCVDCLKASSVRVDVKSDFAENPQKNFDRGGLFDPVERPRHYASHPSGVECIELTRWMTFAVGNAVKYVWRADLKNGRQDYEKALWYLRDAVRHAVFPFILGGSSGCSQVLQLVVEAEPDPHRVRFFTSIRAGDLDEAVRAVTAMLG